MMKSNIEAYLQAMINDTGTDGLPTPKSRIGKLLYVLCGKLGLVQKKSFELTTDKGIVALENSNGVVLSFVEGVPANSYEKNTNVTAAVFPNAKSVGQFAFRLASSLTIADFPNVLTMGNYALNGCPIEAINYPLLAEVGAFCFSGGKFKTVELPSLTKTNENPGGVFKGCASVEEISLPLLETIPMMMFMDCSALTKVNLPKATIIKQQAFFNCPALKNVILRASSVCSIADIFVFTKTPFASGGTGGVVLVPSALVESYKTATNWSTLVGYGTCEFLALEDYTTDGTTTGEIDWDKLNNRATEVTEE